MATIPQYVTALRDRQRIIATKFGSDPARADKQSRALGLAMLVIIACVIKALVDKGLLTDADILSTLNTARDAAYGDEPIVPPDDPSP